MTETSEIGPPFKRRRGVALGSFFIWITLAAVGGAIVWGIYGNNIRSILKLPPAGAPAHWVSTQTNQNQSMMINADEIVGLVKDLQVSQQRTADDVRTVLQTGGSAALLRLVTDPGDKSRDAPKLNGRTFEPRV